VKLDDVDEGRTRDTRNRETDNVRDPERSDSTIGGAPNGRF